MMLLSHNHFCSKHIWIVIPQYTILYSFLIYTSVIDVFFYSTLFYSGVTLFHFVLILWLLFYSILLYSLIIYIFHPVLYVCNYRSIPSCSICLSILFSALSSIPSCSIPLWLPFYSILFYTSVITVLFHPVLYVCDYCWISVGVVEWLQLDLILSAKRWEPSCLNFTPTLVVSTWTPPPPSLTLI